MTGRETWSATMAEVVDAPVAGTESATVTMIDDERIEKGTVTGMDIVRKLVKGIGVELRKGRMKGNEVKKWIAFLQMACTSY